MLLFCSWEEELYIDQIPKNMDQILMHVKVLLLWPYEIMTCGGNQKNMQECFYVQIYIGVISL